MTETFLKARREWIAAGVGGKQAWTRCSPSSWASPETRGQGWDESGPWGHAGGCRGTMDDAGVPLYIGAPCVSLPSSHLEDWLISSPHPCRERRPSLVSPRFTQWPQGGRVGTRELPPPEDADAWAGGRGRCSGSVCSMQRLLGTGERVGGGLSGWSPAPSPTAPSGILAPAGRGSGGAAAAAGVSPGPWRPGDVSGGGGPCPSPIKSHAL